MRTCTRESVLSPTVSVIIPVYNEEKRIRECLDSLINQSFPREKMEWIIIDGGSNDGTRGIVEQYIRNYPIKYLENNRRDTPISLNIGIKNSTGKYIIRFDAHTVFPSDYIEKCLCYLETTEAANVGGLIKTEAEGRIGEAIATVLSSRFGVGGSSFRTGSASGYVDTVPFGAFRREVFEEIGLFNEDLLRSEDNDINARIREAGKKVFLADDIESTYYCRDSISAFLKMGIQNGNAVFRTMRHNRSAMSIRHFIPFLFVMSLVVLPILGLFYKPIWAVLLLEWILYFLLDGYFSFFKAPLSIGLISFWIYPLFHFSYGVGTLLGLMGIKLY